MSTRALAGNGDLPWVATDAGQDVVQELQSEYTIFDAQVGLSARGEEAKLRGGSDLHMCGMIEHTHSTETVLYDYNDRVRCHRKFGAV